MRWSSASNEQLQLRACYETIIKWTIQAENKIGSLPECETIGRRTKRLQLLCSSIIRDADDGDLDRTDEHRVNPGNTTENTDLSFLDQRIERPNASSVTRRHPINFIH